MISFEIKGLRIRVHFSFVLFNALFFLMRSDAMISCFYAACVIHELGHILAAVIIGARLYSVDLRGSGICITARNNVASPVAGGLFLLLSGPLLNLLSFTAVWLAGMFPLFGQISLMLGIYNLLPYSSLDGGSIIGLLISGTPFERTAELIRRSIVCIITAIFIIMCIKSLGYCFFPQSMI